MPFLFFILVFFWYTDTYSDLAAMKESYHICYTSHDEVMFRDREDHGMFINLMALEAWRMKTEILTDAEMSTHIHQNVFTAYPVPYGARLRMSYTKYFNRKYDRKGRMGEPGIFTLKVQGLNHQITLNNYVLRNGQHHNASQTAFRLCILLYPGTILGGVGISCPVSGYNVPKYNARTPSTACGFSGLVRYGRERRFP